MKNYDLTHRKKLFCVKHQTYCRPITGAWKLRGNGWECSDVFIPFPEFTTAKIKEERLTYANDMLQSHRGGDLSKEFVEAYPTRIKKMLKDGAITKTDIKKSKYVWKEVKGVTKKIDSEALL